MAENEQPPSHDIAQLDRVALIWRVLVFQFKLLLDGLRDVILSPVSLVVAVIGLIAGGDTPDRYWTELMRFGRRTDIWINLFDRRPGAADALVDPLERMMTEDPTRRSWLARIDRFFARFAVRAHDD